MASVNDDLRDRAIRHALATRSYSVKLSQDLVRLLNDADADICAKLAAGLASIEDRGVQLSRKTMARLERLLEEVRAINGVIYQRLHEDLADELEEFAAAEAEYQHVSIVRSLPDDLPDLGLALPSTRLLKAIVAEEPMRGKVLSKLVEGQADLRLDAIQQAVRLGMVQGESTDDIVRRVRGTKALNYGDGVLNRSREYATTLVRTSVTHVSNQAAQATWKANERVVGAWQFLATLDSRTSHVCAGNDGKTFPVGQGPVPPLHPRCRSITVAVTKSWKELGIDAEDVPAPSRASMDGQVAGGTTFSSWLKGKDEATQNKVLGKTRASLFRSGKLDLQDFPKNNDQLMTLDQLKQAHKSILSDD